jgi:beta-glucanase (GH16 family)
MAKSKKKSGRLRILLLALALLGLPAIAGGPALAAPPDVIIDNFEDGDTGDWIFFGGNAAGGGGGPLDDRPREGDFYFSTGWGGDGTASGFYGGAFKNFDNAAQVTPPTVDPWFNVWVLNQSNATVDDYTLEITLREDLDGNGWTNGSEDSFRIDTTFPSLSFNDTWTLVSAPLDSFADQFTGGDGSFNGNLDEVVIVVAGVQGGPGSTVELDFDQFSFSSGGPVPFDDFERGLPSGADGDGLPIGFITFSDGSPVSIAVTDTPPAPVPGSAAGNNVLALTGNVNAFAGFVHAFENAAVDTWVPQDWSSFEGLRFWLYGQDTTKSLFVDVLDNRNPGSTGDDAERWTWTLADDFVGWRLIELPFANVPGCGLGDPCWARKDIGNGAPNDGFTLTDVHGWALGMTNTPGAVTYHVDDAELYGIAEIPELAVTFAAANYDIDEGATGDIAVKLNRPMNSEDPAQVSVDFLTETVLAIEGRDFVPTSGTLTFVNGGLSELTFPLETLDDSKWEGDERVILRLTNPVDVAAGFASQAAATIRDNEVYDPYLLDDFEQGAFLWDAEGPVEIDARSVEVGDADERPGQDQVENVGVVGPAYDAAVQSVRDGLGALLPASSSKVAKRIEKAIDRLQDALDTDNWVNGTFLDSKDGKKSFDRIRQAVQELKKIVEDGEPEAAAAQAAIDELVAVSAALATDAVEVAERNGGDPKRIDKAIDEIVKGDDDRAAGRADKAVEHYRKAWQGALKAIDKLVKNGEVLSAGALVRDFAIGQDWTDTESLGFWFNGTGSGETVTVNLKDNRALDPGPDGWNLVWNEEYNEPAGTPPDSEYWSYEIGDGTVNGIPGWGNDEFQYYTDDPANAATDGNGNMVLTIREADGSLLCYYGPCEYTSARLVSSRKAEFAYGRIESRILVPEGGAGLWPAFWSLGTDIDVVGWPQTGEIDFMEYVSRLPNEIFGTIHGPGYSGGQSFGSVYDFGEPVYNGYHTFTIEWEPDLIKWYVDDILYHTATPADVAPNEWVFNDPVFLIYNVAIGGNFGGAIDPNLQLPQSMAIDYVRVYQGPDTAERWEATFVDDFAGWREVTVPMTDFVRSADQPAGAPDDGLGLEEVWGYGFDLPYPAGGGYQFDLIRRIPFPPPTEITVTNLNSGGDGSLRQALEDIAVGGTITFDPSLANGTIALSGPLVVDNDVTVNANDAPGISLDGRGTDRVLIVDPGVAANLSDLTMTNGFGFQLAGCVLNNGSLTLDSVTVTGCTMTTDAGDFWQGGGGIYNGEGATLSLIDSTVSDNTGWIGGGVYSFFNTTTLVERSTISGNTALDVGGGIRSLGNADIVNSTISGNTSTNWHGGGAFITDGVVNVRNSTVTDNNAPGGTAGGLFLGTFGDANATLNLQNSIVAFNGDFGCFLAPFGAGEVAINSLGSNVFTDGTCNPIGSDQVVADAGLGALADNGGPTLTHALLPGSPAIDAADASVCPAIDQRGVARPQGAGCDVGSFEAAP